MYKEFLVDKLLYYNTLEVVQEKADSGFQWKCIQIKPTDTRQ